MKARHIILIVLLAFFSLLMLRTMIPYFSLRDDVSFLKTKQWIIENQVWKIAFFTHVFTSIFLLLSGFTQFFSPFKNAQLHRNVGKMYIVILLFVSGPAGFIMALYANGGIISQLSFTILALLWLFATGKAYLEIRKRNFIAHGNFMIRSYALTLSAVTLRSWKIVITLAFHLPPVDTYRIIAWMGWVPNILIAEYLIRKGWGKRILRGTNSATKT